MKEKQYVWAAVFVLAAITVSTIVFCERVDLDSIRAMQKEINLKQLEMYK